MNEMRIKERIIKKYFKGISKLELQHHQYHYKNLNETNLMTLKKATNGDSSVPHLSPKYGS
jgi:hypothetical protein